MLGEHGLGETLVGVRVDYVEQDCEDDAGSEHAQGHPPEQLLVELLLKVLEDDEAKGEASEGPGEVGHVRHGQVEAMVRVSVVDCVRYVRTRCKN